MAKGSNPLKKIIGLAFLVVGIGLAIWAYQMSGSIGSQIKEVFSGAPERCFRGDRIISAHQKINPHAKAK
jgi:hypothetical protein